MPNNLWVRLRIIKAYSNDIYLNKIHNAGRKKTLEHNVFFFFWPPPHANRQTCCIAYLVVLCLQRMRCQIEDVLLIC